MTNRTLFPEATRNDKQGSEQWRNFLIFYGALASTSLVALASAGSAFMPSVRALRSNKCVSHHMFYTKLLGSLTTIRNLAGLGPMAGGSR